MRSFRRLLCIVALAGASSATGSSVVAQPGDAGAPGDDITPIVSAESANLAGCQLIAQFDNQFVLACEVLWRVNQMLEAHQAKAPPEQRVPPEQLEEVRQQLMQRELGTLLDRKLLYAEFLRSVPPENLSRIDENLREPFEEHELPQLMEQFQVSNQRELEQELARLGSSLADVRRSFNERIIAGEWIRSKIKINEEVSPEEMLQYYRNHLSDYEYPTQARWEELMVRKSRFATPREAYAELARMGNAVWQQGTERAVQGAAFAEVAKTKSDGFTAEQGGLHDWTTQGALKSGAIDEALFSLQLGQMSAILESEEGFHIVRVLERKEAGRRPFTEVQGEIRDRLKEERFKTAVDEYLNELRRNARIWTVFTGHTTADALLARKPDASSEPR